VGEALTSVLDFIGVLIIAAGAAVLVAAWASPGWGLLAGGVLIIAGSFIATLMARTPRGDDE
jgi:hypothetical protein